ncbi:deoxyribose-phosphate aldolase [Hortaea werneckii]|uniref:deoxyribose-phosphate aldolase n=1 Tax=Hortaea werneckii TaxID=91943 RepID=A0A3M6YJI0_HORWE|nr:deoxyribose-phosphate aldolase [Hortaea werneckii]KAI7019114.1 deoxyribose-phosphate aldolase [Hortaea werneckii]KAI7670586.1 deoxyribose-phosphate aldolase [Hortaea werneckii]RMY03012.1 hypothetical protein D0867_10845 [Hortaea werneckii]RMY24897.1 hypothetical protein D0866_11263 [Hortaea werneckii]
MATAHLAGAVAVPDQESAAHNVESRYTNAEWARFLSEVEKGITVSEEPCPCPDVGSPALAKTIDHTLLKLDVRPIQFDELCSEARVDGFATVCVRPPFVRKCVSDLKGSGVKVASVIGFHEGTYDLYHKIEETKQSLEAGAEELDVVINYEDLKAQDYSKVYKELATLRMQAPHPVMLKLILETSQLDRSQIIAGCALAAAAHYDFVKTSTGFKGHWATIEHVRLMKACCDNVSVVNGTGRTMRVKASGGIRTIEDAVKMLEAGASRLGTSGGVWIVKEGREQAERSQSPPSAREGSSTRPGLTTRLFTDY